ncbi:hypothetical protein D3C77_388370 [compost metagenome]
MPREDLIESFISFEVSASPTSLLCKLLTRTSSFVDELASFSNTDVIASTLSCSFLFCRKEKNIPAHCFFR